MRGLVVGAATRRGERHQDDTSKGRPKPTLA
jgi:hypothetical protein